MITAAAIQEDAAHLMEIPSDLAPEMAGARDLGRIAADTTIGLQLQLRRPVEQENLLDAFVHQTERPDSALYGKTMTPREFAEQFGLSGQDLDKITSWLISKGFAVSSIDNARLTVDFRGNAWQIEQAFHTEIHQYQGRDGETHFANDAPVKLPRAIGRAVTFVEGLQSFTPFHQPGFDGPVTDFALGTEKEMLAPEAASGTLTVVHLNGATLWDASFTSAKTIMNFSEGGTVLNVRVGGDGRPVTGSITITSQEYGAVAVIRDITACESTNSGYGRSCTVAFRPIANGIYTLHALYSGDESTRATDQKLTIIVNVAMPSATQVATISPIAYVCNTTSSATCTTTAASGTISYVLSWSGALGQPTGTVAFTLGGSGGYIPGSLTLPAAGATSSSGSCTAMGASGATVGTCSYSCTYNATNQADQMIACTLTDSAMNYVLAASSGGASIKAAFTDTDGNYANIGAATLTEAYFGTNIPKGTAAITTSNTLTAMTYGQTQTEGPLTVLFTPNGGVTYSNYNPGSGSSQAFWELTGPLQLGSFLNNNALTANSEGATSTVPAAGGTFTTPAVVTPSSTPYTVTLSYSGNYLNTTSAYTSTSLNLSLQVNKAQPTIVMATPTSAAPVSQTYGSTTPFNVTATLGWSGVGAAPTAANVTFTSTAAGMFATTTCGAITTGGTVGANTQTNSQTCTAAFTPAGTSSVGSYNFSASYTTDTNYLAASASTITSDFKITAATPALGTVSFSPASSEPYGTSQAITLSDSLTFSGAAPTGAVTFTVAGTNYTASCGTTSPATCSYTVPAATVAALPAGNYSVTVSIAAAGNYNSASGTSATFSITQLTSSLVLSDTTPGTTTTGVTSTTVTATANLNMSGIAVTFHDTTTGAILGTANTNSSGVATLAITTATTGVAAGLNNLTASIAGTANYTAVTSSKSVIYLQGILFSFVGTHDFSGLITEGGMQVEGTLDGTPASAYGVGIYNFTASSQTLPVTLANSASKAFTLADSCGTTLAAGELCTLVFNYAPPFGDGCTAGAGGTCTNDSSGYPQGTFESATWTYSLPTGTIAGLGNSGFSTSGVAATTGTLEGKAIQAPEALTVTPTAAAFGNVAQGAASNTITVAVTNSNAQPVSFSYAGPTTSNFTANNSCSSPIAAKASCNIYVTMVTASSGSFSDSIVITPSGSTATTVSLSGTVAASSTGITLTSTSHNFGSVTDGTQVSFGVELTNNTTGAATLGFSNTAGTGFSVVNGCGATLAAQASCNYTFTFAPTAAGAVSDTLVVQSNVPLLPGGTGSGSSYTDTLTVIGTGVAGGQFTATSVKHNFGSLAVGTSGGNYGVELANNTASSVTLSFSGLTNTADGFSLVGSSCGATLAVNANCELVFTFTPATSGLGTVTAVYPITASAALNSGGSVVSPAQITLVGTGQ